MRKNIRKLDDGKERVGEEEIDRQGN